MHTAWMELEARLGTQRAHAGAGSTSVAELLERAADYQYAALLLLSDDEASRKVAALLSQMWDAVHAASSDNLLILSPVSRRSPDYPPGWRTSLERLVAEEFQGEFTNFPLICYLVRKKSIDEPGTTIVDALAFPFPPCQREDDLLAVIRKLGNCARNASNRDASEREFAELAHALGDPTSLRWINASRRTAPIVRTLLDLWKKYF